MVFITIISFFATQAFALMDVSSPRGERIINHGQKEICVIPKKFAEANYSSKDLANEQKLCQMDFYIDNPTQISGENEYAAGLCPKLHNTNPGLEIYRIEENQSKLDLEEKNCDMPSSQRTAKKIAKYKISSSCSYTPALLSYYHVSRILGGILNVPTAVLRTLDVNTYKSMPQKGKVTLSKGGVIAATWKALVNQLNNPTTDKRAPYLFTTDYLQTFGGLAVNPSGESVWKEISNDAGGVQLDRGKAFMKEQVYLDLLNPELVSKTVSNQWTTENVQQLKLLGDVSDMLVLDFILRQEDRFNNIAYQLEVEGLVQDANVNVESKSLKVDKTDSPEELAVALAKFNEQYPNSQPVVIRRVVLKDNECGVAVDGPVGRSNIVEQLKMLEPIRHLKKSTYDHLQRFSAYISSSATAKEAEDFFKKETLMTTSDLSQFFKNIRKLATQMKTQCMAGTLHLDLNTKTHFIETYKAGAENCIVD